MINSYDDEYVDSDPTADDLFIQKFTNDLKKHQNELTQFLDDQIAIANGSRDFKQLNKVISCLLEKRYDLENEKKPIQRYEKRILRYEKRILRYTSQTQRCASRIKKYEGIIRQACRSGSDREQLADTCYKLQVARDNLQVARDNLQVAHDNLQAAHAELKDMQGDFESVSVMKDHLKEKLKGVARNLIKIKKQKQLIEQKQGDPQIIKAVGKLKSFKKEFSRSCEQSHSTLASFVKPLRKEGVDAGDLAQIAFKQQLGCLKQLSFSGEKGKILAPVIEKVGDLYQSSEKSVNEIETNWDQKTDKNMDPLLKFSRKVGMFFKTLFSPSRWFTSMRRPALFSRSNFDDVQEKVHGAIGPVNTKQGGAHNEVWTCRI